ncbi:microtubule-actin cross-linking factor 1, isoforms 6/7-like [Panonychus citri]|uniref:microtubule-actin cross-linking factor 1, isoforms 6/7-like n=1 Tax=Panonychus citri TaxID=50023 RepID=UPI0023078D7C|nr:microtubule-actin cross-linking factor 1, isoforms 6/7-like [Panonychus citri]
MADEGQSSGKFNETRSKSVIYRSPDGKSITKHTSIHITRVNGSNRGSNEGTNLGRITGRESRSSPSPSSTDRYQRPSSQPLETKNGSIYYRCKSTSPNRFNTLPKGSRDPINGTSLSTSSLITGINPAIRRTSSSLQISVNIRSPSANDLIYRQSRSPLPIRRSQTTFESSWVLSSYPPSTSPRLQSLSSSRIGDAQHHSRSSSSLSFRSTSQLASNQPSTVTADKTVQKESGESTIKNKESPKQSTSASPPTPTPRKSHSQVNTNTGTNGSPSPTKVSPSRTSQRPQVSLDLGRGRKSDPSPSRISITRETISSRTIKPKDVTIIEPVKLISSRSSSPVKGSILRSPSRDRVIRSTEKSSDNLITKETTAENEVYEKTLIIPLDGWTVSDAAEKGYLNMETGNFTVPGSDHQINLRDCCRLKIINPSSGEVVDPSRPFTRPTNFNLAFERGLIDSNGNYLASDREPKLSLAQALERKYVTLNDKVKTSSLMARKVIKITQSRSNQVAVTLEPELLVKARNESSQLNKQFTMMESQSTGNENKISDESGEDEEHNVTEIAFIDDDDDEEDTENEDHEDELIGEIDSSDCDGRTTRTTIETIRADDLTTETITADLIVGENLSNLDSDSGDENWSEIVDEISQRLDIIKENEKFQSNYSSLSSWLETIESRMNNLGPIGNDLKLISAQRNKLSSIRTEFKNQLVNRQAFISSGKLLSTRMDPNCNEYQQIDRLTSKLLIQWRKCESLLTEKEKSVKSLDSFIESFGGKLSSLENDIDCLISELDDLKMSDVKVGEKCKRLDTINGQLTLSKSTLAECEVITDHLYQLVGDQSKADEVRTKFNSIERKSVELSNEIDSVNQYLTKLRDFEECEATLNEWLSKVSTELETELRVSTDESELKNELNQIERLRSEFDRREADLRSLESMGTGLLEAASSLATGASAVQEISRVSGRVESVQLTWNELSKEIDCRVSRLESALKSFVTIKSQLMIISNWLDELDVEVSNVADLTYDQGSLEVQLKAIEAIAFEMNGKSAEYDKINQITLDSFNVGVKESREEINGLIERWKSIAKDTEERRSRLKGLLDSLRSLDCFIDEITCDYEATNSKTNASGLMESPTFETRSIDRIKSLLESVKSLERKVDRARTIGLDLAKQFETVGQSTETQSIVKVEPLNRIESLSNRVSSLRLSIETRYSLLLGTKRSVDKIHRKIDSVERTLNRLVETSHKLPTIVTRDSVTLTKQKEETTELQGEVNSFSSEIQDLENTIEAEKSCLSIFQVTYKNFLSTIESIDSRRVNLLSNLNERYQKIDSSLREAQDVEATLHEFADWLKTIESIVDSMEESSYLVDTIEKQLKETSDCQTSITSKRDVLSDLERRGPRREKEMLISIRSRYNKLTSKVTKRYCTLERNLKSAKEFIDKWNGLINWLSGTETIVSANEQVNCSNISVTIGALRELNREFDHKSGHLDSVCRLGRSLRDKSPKSDNDAFRNLIDTLRTRWTNDHKNVQETLRKTEKISNALDRYKKLVKQLKDWLAEAVISFDRLQGDPETIQRLIKDHNNFTKQLALKNDSMIVLKDCVDELVDLLTPDCIDSETILTEYASLSTLWDELNLSSQEKEIRLREYLQSAEQLKSQANKMLNWLIEIETSMGKYKSTTGADEVTLRLYIDEINDYIEKMGSTVADRDEIISSSNQVLTDCHPDAHFAIHHYIEIIESTWDDVARSLVKKESELRSKLDEMVKRSAYLAELSAWLTTRETEYDLLDSKSIPNEIEPIQELIDEMETYRATVNAKENELDKLAEENRKEPVGKRRRTGHESVNSNYSKSSSDLPLDQIGDPKVIDILTRWRGLTSRTRDRLIRLRSKMNFYLELEKLRDFDFDSWRRRFIDWLDNRSARLMDFYRKLDDNRDNKVTYDEFIEGFMRHKFPGNRSELQRVAAIFDRNNDGFIDNKEWMDKLKDPSEIEIIVSEMRKQSAKCTCSSKYRVHQVEDKKYQFGESHKQRLVRILRSDIMVRVGGGWISLTEFLLKNDPCRAKGRTNVELREPLADGVSQGMASFQSRSPYFGNSSFLGPITNIREKTERSVPMCQSADDDDEYPMDDDSISGDAVSSSRPQSRLTFIAKDDRCPSRASSSQEKKLRIDTRPRWH